ncbi:MAG: hypothetical protein IJC76_02845 [Lachnospiraceae bacterium]|nr:hypothetical protein [Lachnospiraceae bacterium]
MKSKKFFNLKLYLAGLKQFVLVALIICASSIIVPIIIPATSYLLTNVYLIAIFAFYMHNYVTKLFKTDQTEYTRACIIFSYTTALLTYSFVILLIPSILMGFCGLFVANLLFISAFLLAWSLTDNNYLCFALSLIILSPQALITYIAKTVYKLCSYLDKSKIYPLLNGELNLLTNNIGIKPHISDYNYNSLSGIIYTTIFALILTILAILVLTKVKSAQNALLTFVSIYICSATCLFPLHSIIRTIYYGKQVGLPIIASIAIFLAVICIYVLWNIYKTKQNKTKSRALTGVLIIITFNIVISGAILLICKSFASFTPTAAEIDYVIIENGSPSHDVDPYMHLIYAKTKVSDTESLEIIANLLDKNVAYSKNLDANGVPIYDSPNNNFKTIKVTICSNGSTEYRKLRIDENNLSKLFSNIEKTDKFIELASNLPKTITNGSYGFNGLIFIEALDIYNIYIKEFEALDEASRKEMIINNCKLTNDFYSGLDDFSNSNKLHVLYDNGNSFPGYYTLIIDITKATPKAYAKYQEYLTN